ncbi:hypothetical protein E2C01_041428 [Portunus trituberculatus]|uniref:Uncharacterized protein n=1 Tax=Portunus trituberculatus TaxID=210409 RepID=A0A5B7FQF2_PORTR|nr:hypothetical protein [Portunus trituberculatus]
MSRLSDDTTNLIYGETCVETRRVRQSCGAWRASDYLESVLSGMRLHTERKTNEHLPVGDTKLGHSVAQFIKTSKHKKI